MRRLISIIATSAILLNSVIAPMSVLAQETTPTPETTPSATATPTETATPEPTIEATATPVVTPTETPADLTTPTPEITATPTETATPEPTIEATATPTNNEVQNTPAQDQQISSPTTAPTTIATSTPTSTPEPKEDANVSVSVVTTNLFPETVQENSVVKLITDKLDYSPTEVAVITGSGFESGKAYSLTVSSSDDPATSTTSDITTDGSGSFTYNYQLDGNYRPNYSVEVQDGETVVATTSFTDSSWLSCSYQCSSNDVTVQKIELVKDTSGSPITCNPGDTVTAYIKVTYDNHSTTRHAVYIKGDIYQDGEFKQTVDSQTSCITDLTTTQNSKIMATGFTWKCGSSISIKNLVLSWGNNSSTCNDVFLNGVCNPPGHSYCNNGLDYIVATPLVADFTAPPVCLGTPTTFTSTTSGGQTPYTNYAWAFGDASTGSGQTTTHTYTSVGTYQAKLTVTDSKPQTDDQTHDVVVNSCARCGDGVINQVSEQCDDGNTTNGDGCSSTCQKEPGTLTVIKNVINDNGGLKNADNFTISVTNGTPNSFAGSTAGTSVSVAAGSSFNVSEGDYYGYSTTMSGTCSGTMTAGAHVTCTVTNNDIQPKLTVTKIVDNTNGGDKTVSDFPLFVNTTGVTSGVQNGFDAGTYTVSETNQGNYRSVISGNCASNGSITLAVGDVKSCTITNTHYKNSPTISTVLSGSSVNVGGVVHDTATLTGATSNAGGTVTYNVYSDSSCSTLFAGPGVKTVTNGSIPNSDDVTFTKAGDYYWQASYSGDTNNNSALSACIEEHLVINKVNPAISTLPNPTTALLGATIFDTATLSGGYNPTGKIAFSLFGPGNTTCDVGSRMGYEEVTVNGNGTYTSPNFSNTVYAGTWRWVASYSGDTNNNSISGGCSDELVTINKVNTNVTTSVYNAEGQDITNSTDVLGANVHDSATVSGQVGVIGITGTITYNFYENYTCNDRPVSTETTTIPGDSLTTSSNTKLNMGAGSYSYMATYSGDSNYNGSTGICEPFNIGKANSSVTTEVHNSDHTDITNQTVEPGISVHDSATVLGTSQSFRPTGNVTYYFFTNGSCDSEPIDSETVEVGTETETRLISEPGSYSYQANYEGDNNFNSSIGECEPFTVGSPAISISKSNDSGSGVHAGSVITYTLTISNSGSMNLGNIKVTDVLPGGFSYVVGSTSGATTDDPTISGAVLSWNLESLEAGEAATITYKATTGTDLSDGTYTNFATCNALYGRESTVYCNQTNSNVLIGSTFGYSGNLSGGQVLGASTELPDTGSPTVLVIIGCGFLAAGIMLNIATRKKYAKK